MSPLPAALSELDIDLTLSQYRTVGVLAYRGPQRTTDPARELGVHSSKVTRVCDRLIRRGLVHREHGRLDRRVAWLALTEQGEDLVERTIRRRTAELSKLVEATPVAGTEQVIRLLDALVTAAGEPPERQWRRDGVAPPLPFGQLGGDRQPRATAG